MVECKEIWGYVRRARRCYDVDVKPRILVAATRPAEGAVPTTDEPPEPYELAWVSPLIVTPRFADTKQALARLAEVRTIALTSAHAVDSLIGALRALGHDVRSLFGIKLAVVGEATAAQLGTHGLSADLVAEGGGAELAHEIVAARLFDPILYLAAKDGRPELAEILIAAGLRVDRVAAYETSPDIQSLKAARLAHAATPYDGIAFCSPRGVDALVDVFGGAARLQNVKGRPILGAIGETTLAALRTHGLTALVPARPSVKGVIALLAEELLR